MQKVENKQSNSPNNKTSVYVFSGEQGKRDSIIVVAQLSPEFTARLVDRWQALESGEATPAFRLEPQPKRQPITSDIHVAALKLSRTAMAAARAFGLQGNQAALSADHAISVITGTSPLALLGLTHLAADPRGRTYTPTELGKMLVDPMSAVKLNKLLEEKGLQVHDISGGWSPLEDAEGLYEWTDTAKKHSSGAPVKQLKWFVGVLDKAGVEYKPIGEVAA